MVRDVYAGDDGSHAAAVDRKVRATYRVLTDLDPAALSRVVQQFALANIAPVWVTCVRLDDDSMEVQAVMQELSEAVAEFIRRKLMQLTCVFEAECMVEPFAG